MSVDFSGYETSGTIGTLNLPYVWISEIYNKNGFNKPMDEKCAYSATERYFAGRYVTTFSNKQVTKFDSADSLYNVRFEPYVTSSPLVYTYFGRTYIGYTSGAYNGYNSPKRAMSEPVEGDWYSFRSSYVNFQHSFEPRRIRIAIPDTTVWIPELGRQVSFSEIAKEWIQQSNWKMSSVGQWWESYSLDSMLKSCIWCYDNSPTFSTTTAPGTYLYYQIGSDYSPANHVFRSSNDKNFYTSLYTGLSANPWSSCATFYFDKGSGAMTSTDYDGFDFTNKTSALYMIQYGRYPVVQIKYQDFANHFNLIGSESADGKSLYYINNKFYHAIGGKFYDENGVEMDEPEKPDFEMGAFKIDCIRDDSWQYGCVIRPIAHISNLFQVVASAGVPFSFPGINPQQLALFDTLGQTGDDTSAWYQAPVNNDGRVIADYKPLSKDPKNFQGIIDPAVIVITPAGDEPIDSTPLEVPPAYYIGAGTEVYALTQGQVESTMVNLFSLPTSIIETIDKFNNTLGESIKSILVFPFNITNLFKTVQGNMVFHGEEILSNVHHVRQSTTIYEMGTYTVPSTNTFLDYSPYCNYYLYLPYCGVIRLDSRDVVGKAISVKYVIDILTGSCTANIFREGILIRSESGTIGVHIPITSRDFTEMANTLLSAGVDSANAVISGVMSVGQSGKIFNSGRAGAIPGIAGSISTALEVANNLDRLADSSVQQKGNPTTSGAFVLPQYPFIIRIKAKESTYKGYAHEKGVACLKTDNFHNFHGYTVFQNFDTSGIPLLEEELMELKRIMESGVYI